MLNVQSEVSWEYIVWVPRRRLKIGDYVSIPNRRISWIRLQSLSPIQIDAVLFIDFQGQGDIML